MNSAALCQSCERMAAAEVDIKNLTSWQDSQNGKIQRVDEKVERVDAKVDGLKNWIMASAAAAGLNLFVGIILSMLAYALKGGGR